ncbi:hypothetical protein [Streptomyces sp. NPDC088146]
MCCKSSGRAFATTARALWGVDIAQAVAEVDSDTVRPETSA